MWTNNTKQLNLVVLLTVNVSCVKGFFFLINGVLSKVKTFSLPQIGIVINYMFIYCFF